MKNSAGRHTGYLEPWPRPAGAGGCLPRTKKTNTPSPYAPCQPQKMSPDGLAHQSSGTSKTAPSRDPVASQREGGRRGDGRGWLPGGQGLSPQATGYSPGAAEHSGLTNRKGSAQEGTAAGKTARAPSALPAEPAKPRPQRPLSRGRRQARSSPGGRDATGMRSSRRADSQGHEGHDLGRRFHKALDSCASPRWRRGPVEQLGRPAARAVPAEPTRMPAQAPRAPHGGPVPPGGPRHPVPQTVPPTRHRRVPHISACR